MEILLKVIDDNKYSYYHLDTYIPYNLDKIDKYYIKILIHKLLTKNLTYHDKIYLMLHKTVKCKYRLQDIADIHNDIINYMDFNDSMTIGCIKLCYYIAQHNMEVIKQFMTDIVALNNNIKYIYMKNLFEFILDCINGYTRSNLPQKNKFINIRKTISYMIKESRYNYLTYDLEFDGWVTNTFRIDF